ncbi:hypothetical protein DXT99_22695 [Pontibacter diazotrophicus]|uniref:Uncharacterized protein n=2 Tax=Pontibacter diazotrophicus TaxID=1400979 RepID=A0A3D8L5J0_9BACT|nr:hypothetical protein DXT99_22695 [Pontibacter diazotrophicus]
MPPVSFYSTDGNGVNLVSDSGGDFHPDSVEVKTDTPPYTTYIQRKHSPQKGGTIFEVYPNKEQSGTTTFYINVNSGIKSF